MIDEILNNIDLDTLLKKYNSDYNLILITIDKHIDYLTDTIDNYSIQDKMIKDKMSSDIETLKQVRKSVNNDRQINRLGL